MEEACVSKPEKLTDNIKIIHQTEQEVVNDLTNNNKQVTEESKNEHDESKMEKILQASIEVNLNKQTEKSESEEQINQEDIATEEEDPEQDDNGSEDDNSSSNNNEEEESETENVCHLIKIELSFYY